ncbi:MAG: hypothetical protein KIT56_05105 [Gammaproteobacteria bacterium]|nr:hypothetical protein [Gammaproteobacteria bacterium]MCW5583253.1 hypothetical protein [Gammaproteobacteria bacterium]
MLVFRKLCVVFVIILSVVTANYVYAMATTGMYIGAQFGYAATNEEGLSVSDVAPDLNKIVNTVPGSTATIDNMNFTINALSINSIDITSFVGKTKDNVFTGRLYIGYQFYSNAAIEFGYTKFRNISLNYDALLNANSTITLNNVIFSPATFTIGNDSRKDTLQQDGLDLMMKGILPINDRVDLYAKIGLTWLYTRTESELSISGINNVILNGTPNQINPPLSFSITNKDRSSNIYPTLALGLNYYFTPDTGVDLSFSRIVGNSSGNQNNIDYLSAGIIYHINSL